METTVAITNSVINQAEYISGSGNIQNDPLLDADYHLTSLSPCIDKGNPETMPDIDFDGDARPQQVIDLLPDIGADEFVPGL